MPTWHPRYWSAGVFYYNPGPTRTTVVHRSSGGKVVHKQARTTEDTRAVDREGDFGIGLIGGSYMSGYDMGGGYGDMGLGLSAKLRPVESLGLELSYAVHDQSFEDDTERINRPLQASAQLYAFPWTRVSPYFTAGLTWNNRTINDTFYDGLVTREVTAEDTLFGPHAGLGVEFAVGENAAINFEGRYIGFVDVDLDDPSAPSAMQGNMGLSFYF